MKTSAEFPYKEELQNLLNLYKKALEAEKKNLKIKPDIL
jgi:hypothetical protein